jgi:hypothetical protein
VQSETIDKSGERVSLAGLPWQCFELRRGYACFPYASAKTNEKTWSEYSIIGRKGLSWRGDRNRAGYQEKEYESIKLSCPPLLRA